MPETFISAEPALPNTFEVRLWKALGASDDLVRQWLGRRAKQEGELEELAGKDVLGGFDPGAERVGLGLTPARPAGRTEKALEGFNALVDLVTAAGGLGEATPHFGAGLPESAPAWGGRREGAGRPKRVVAEPLVKRPRGRPKVERPEPKESYEAPEVVSLGSMGRADLQKAFDKVVKAGDAALAGGEPEKVRELVGLESLIRSGLREQEGQRYRLPELKRAVPVEGGDVPNSLLAERRRVELRKLIETLIPEAPIQRLGTAKAEGFDDLNRGLSVRPEPSLQAKGGPGGEAYVRADGRFGVFVPNAVEAALANEIDAARRAGRPFEPSVRTSLSGGPSSLVEGELGEFKPVRSSEVPVQATYGEDLSKLPRGRNAGDIRSLSGQPFTQQQFPVRGEGVDRAVKTTSGEPIPGGESLLRDLRNHEADLLEDLAKTSRPEDVERLVGELQVVRVERAKELKRLESLRPSEAPGGVGVLASGEGVKLPGDQSGFSWTTTDPAEARRGLVVHERDVKTKELPEGENFVRGASALPSDKPSEPKRSPAEQREFDKQLAIKYLEKLAAAGDKEAAFRLNLWRTGKW